MSGPSYTERIPAESPLLWPCLALLVIAIACFTYFWDGHRYDFPYSTSHGPLLWPPPPRAAAPPVADQASTPANVK